MPRRRAGQRLGAAAGRARHEHSLLGAGLGLAGGLGQAPVHHQRLAMLAHDDVARLEVAVQHAPAVGVVDGVADVHESPQQLAQLQRPPAGVFFSVSSAWKCSMASLRLSPRMNRMA